LRKRLILLVPLLALFAFVATTEERAEAANITIQGESFNQPASGTNLITGTGYSGGAALKFTDNVAASHPVNCSSTPCDVVLMASGGQSGGQASFSVNGSTPQALDSTTTTPYTFHLAAGATNIEVKAEGTGTGHNAILDVVTYSASDGGTDTTPPDTIITSPPSGSVIGTSVTFTFTEVPDELGSTFQCKLIGWDSTRTDCTSTQSRMYTNLTVGTQYTFKVWARDAAGNIDPTPATFTFTPTSSGGTDPTPPPSDWPYSDCEKDIRPGADIDNIINSDPSGTPTTFCVYAGRYTVSAPAILKAGDKLAGEPGTVDTIDLTRTTNTATKPTPKVKLEGSGTDNLLGARGTGISISWVDLSGAKGTGTGSGAIKAGSAGSDFLVEYSRIHDNASLGISNMHGRVLHSEFFSNSFADSSLGVNGSAVKGITEFEAGYLYVHDEQGNGLWCDVGCSNDDARKNGFWVHDSVVVDSDRAGIRYENSPNQALFNNNEIHGNATKERRGGIDIRDSRNATVTNNKFGPATISIAGVNVNYSVNGDRIGARATDSGRSDRVDLSDIVVENNDMNGDSIVSCGGKVTCRNNTP
jgi:hypothetical protein